MMDKKKVQLQKARTRVLKKVRAYTDIFDTPAGKEVLYDLLKEARVFHTEYDKDPSFFIFKEGRRDIINYILSQLKWNEAKVLNFFSQREQEESVDEIF